MHLWRDSKTSVDSVVVKSVEVNTAIRRDSYNPFSHVKQVSTIQSTEVYAISRKKIKF